jgi:hypothetical protein
MGVSQRPESLNRREEGLCGACQPFGRRSAVRYLQAAPGKATATSSACTDRSASHRPTRPCRTAIAHSSRASTSGRPSSPSQMSTSSRENDTSESSGSGGRVGQLSGGSRGQPPSGNADATTVWSTPCWLSQRATTPRRSCIAVSSRASTLALPRSPSGMPDTRTQIGGPGSDGSGRCGSPVVGGADGGLPPGGGLRDVRSSDTIPG